MHKLSLSLILLGALYQSASATEVSCPSTAQINQVMFVQAMIPMDGDIFATSQLLPLDSNHIWSVVIHGLDKANVEEANEKIKLIDICESEIAVPYHSNLFDSLACDYHSSTNMKINVHAVIAKDNPESHTDEDKPNIPTD